MPESLPTQDQVLETLDRLSPEASRHLPDGTPLVSWQQLAYALFEKGSPFWRRPVGQPHGLDQSPAYSFMDRLGFEIPEIRRLNIYGGQYFCRRKP